MKITCNQAELIKALNIVSRAVTSRTTIPVLKGILLQADQDQTLTLSASDLEISIETQMNAVVQEPGSLVVSAKLFSDIVRKLPGGEILLEKKESDTLEIKCRHSEFIIMSEAAEEFPKIQNTTDGDTLSFDKNDLRDMIRRTSFAASIDEARGIIIGVLMELKEDTFNMVALDGFRMAVVREKTQYTEPRNIVINARVLSETGKILGDSEVPFPTESGRPQPEKEEAKEAVDEKKETNAAFNMILDDKKAIFDLGKTKIVTRLLEGDFIKYHDILPKDNPIVVTVSREDLQSAIERASILIREGRNNFLKLTLENGQMIITSRSEEGAIREEVAVDQSGDDLDIGFNAKFILDVLKVIEDEEIRMEFKTPVSPCLIKPLEGNGWEYLILPVRLTARS